MQNMPQIPSVLDISHRRLVHLSAVADIFEVRNASSLFAIKKFRSNHTNPGSKKREALLFTRLSRLAQRLKSHPMCLNFLSFQITRVCIGGVSTPVIAMPFFKNGSVLDHIQNYRGLDILLLVKQIANGMAALHRYELVHSNVYPGNVLITSAGACITDVGIHAIYFQTLLDSDENLFLPNSWSYKSREEQLRDGTENGSRPFLVFTKDMDVYCFASTVYSMYSGGPPFSMHPQGAYEILDYGHTRLSKPDPMSDALWSLLRQCWALIPAERPTMEAVAAMLFAM